MSSEFITVMVWITVIGFICVGLTWYMLKRSYRKLWVLHTVQFTGSKQIHGYLKPVAWREPYVQLFHPVHPLHGNRLTVRWIGEHSAWVRWETSDGRMESRIGLGSGLKTNVAFTVGTITTEVRVFAGPDGVMIFCRDNGVELIRERG